MRAGVRAPTLRAVDQDAPRATQLDARAAPTPAAALGAVAGGVAMGAASQYLFVRERIGLDVLVAVVLCAALALSVKRKPLERTDLLLLGAVVFAALCALRAEAAVQLFDAFAAVALLLVWLVPLDALLSALGTRAGPAFAAAMPAMRERLPASRRPLRYAAGSALAIPFLVVFAALFSSADAVFERSLRAVLDLAWLRDLFRDLPARTIVAVFVAWCATGAFANRDAVRRAPRLHLGPLVSSDTAVALLVAIDALFAIFVWLQVAYLFGGRDTLDASGIAYSAYARRGFFELVAVAAIVGGLLFALGLVLEHRGRAYLVAALALIALTGVILASAAYRMSLYQAAYGWSELRLYANALIALLAIALVLLAIATIARDVSRFPERLVAAAAVVAIAVNLIGPARTVATANLDRFVDPSGLPADANRSLDIGYLVSLGDAAMPAIAERIAALPTAPRAALEAELRRYASGRAADGGWQSWNWDRARASEVLSGR